MTEPNVRPYEAEITYDLRTFKEFQKGNRLYFLRTKSPYLIYLFCALLMTYVYAFLYRSTTILSWYLLLLLAVFWGIRLFHYIADRNGGIGYKRMLSDNAGKPRHSRYQFLSDGIHETDMISGGVCILPYSQVRSVFETENLLTIVLEHRRVLSLDKRTLSGGPVSSFVEKLLLFSPNAKKKKLSSLTPGKVIEGITIVLSIVFLLLAIWWSAPVTRMREASRTIQPDMSYRQMAQALEPYGIHDIPDSVFDELEEMDAAYSDFYTPSTTDRCLSLLCWAGYGSFDYDTWERTPAECGVFWFDCEAFGSMDQMYTSLLQGISALSPEELDFSDYLEDVTAVDMDAGTGTQTIRFTWKGSRHSLTAKVDYDWYDLSVLDALSDLIRDETGKRLYFAWDGGQGYLVFYGDRAWARDFSEATGIILYTSPFSAGAMF